MFDGYVPPTEYGRHLLEEKRRARAAGRSALMKMGAAFGVEPDPGTVGGTYYDLSDDDRALIEQVIADNQSSDLLRQKAAFDWWSSALDIAAGPVWWNRLSGAILEGGSAILDLLGRQVLQPFDFSGELCALDNGYWSAILTSFELGEAYISGLVYHVDITATVSFTLRDWECSFATPPGHPDGVTTYAMVAICSEAEGQGPGGTIVAHDGQACAAGGATVEGDQRNLVGVCPSPATFDLPDTDPLVMPANLTEVSWVETAISGSGGTQCFYGHLTTVGDEAFTSQPICPGEAMEPPSVTTQPPTFRPPGDTTPPDLPFTSEQVCRLIDELRDYPYRPTSTPTPGEPCEPTAPPPIFDPNDPGSGTPPEPGDPPTGGAQNPVPIESGKVDPVDGGQITLPTNPPNFQDPTLPGNINTPYQPGQTACIDNGDGSQFCSPIDRVIPSPSGPVGPSAPNLPGLSGLPGITSPPIGPTIDLRPTIPSDRTLNEKKCYGPEAGGDPVPVINEIGRALNDLGIESDRIIFDSDCDHVLTRPMCFVAGTNKRRILNILLDMCGFCVYPQPDGNVIVGLCGPSNVHWYYHEDVDLLAWDLEYDGQDAYAFVRVFSPTYSEMIPVSTPIAVPPDKIYHMEFPLGFPKTSALSAGYAKAADIGRMALPLTGFHVPLNPLLRLRDQVHIRRPTKGFMGIYMATKLANDYDRRAYLTTGLGRWLGPDSL